MADEEESVESRHEKEGDGENEETLASQYQSISKGSNLGIEW
jgi:hypothetical protein